MNETVINTGMIVSYILLGLATLVAIVGPAIQLITNFKKARTALLGIVILAGILFLGFSLATNETYDGAGALASQWIGGGIIATMILIGLTLATAVFTEIAKFFK